MSSDDPDPTICNICDELFDDTSTGEHAPISPSCCGNAVCRLCILRFYEAKQEGKAGTKRNKFFSCPNCNMPKAFHIDKIPAPHFGFLSMITQARHAKAEAERAAQLSICRAADEATASEKRVKEIADAAELEARAQLIADTALAERSAAEAAKQNKLVAEMVAQALAMHRATEVKERDAAIAEALRRQAEAFQRQLHSGTGGKAMGDYSGSGCSGGGGIGRHEERDQPHALLSDHIPGYDDDVNQAGQSESRRSDWNEELGTTKATKATKASTALLKPPSMMVQPAAALINIGNLEQCRQFAYGSCARGAACMYAHGNVRPPSAGPAFGNAAGTGTAVPVAPSAGQPPVGPPPPGPSRGGQPGMGGQRGMGQGPMMLQGPGGYQQSMPMIGGKGIGKQFRPELGPEMGPGMWGWDACGNGFSSIGPRGRPLNPGGGRDPGGDWDPNFSGSGDWGGDWGPGGMGAPACATGKGGKGNVWYKERPKSTSGGGGGSGGGSIGGGIATIERGKEVRIPAGDAGLNFTFPAAAPQSTYTSGYNDLKRAVPSEARRGDGNEELSTIKERPEPNGDTISCENGQQLPCWHEQQGYECCSPYFCSTCQRTQPTHKTTTRNEEPASRGRKRPAELQIGHSRLPSPLPTPVSSPVPSILSTPGVSIPEPTDDDIEDRSQFTTRMGPRFGPRLGPRLGPRNICAGECGELPESSDVHVILRTPGKIALTIPSKMESSLIGKSGVIINHIRSATMAHVVVSSAGSICSDHQKISNRTRVEISGTPQECAAAERAVNLLMAGNFSCSADSLAALNASWEQPRPAKGINSGNLQKCRNFARGSCSRGAACRYAHCDELPMSYSPISKSEHILFGNIRKLVLELNTIKGGQFKLAYERRFGVNFDDEIGIKTKVSDLLKRAEAAGACQLEREIVESGSRFTTRFTVLPPLQ